MNWRMNKMYRSPDGGDGAGTGGEIAANVGGFESTLDWQYGDNKSAANTGGTGGTPPNTGAENGNGEETGTGDGTNSSSTAGATGTDGSVSNTGTGSTGGTANENGENTSGEEGNEGNEELTFIESVIETLGEEFTDEEYASFTNDEEGVAKVINVLSSRLADSLIQKDFNTFISMNPEVAELMEAKKNGMLEHFYSAKANGGVPQELSVSEDNKDLHYNIILENLISNGMTKETAEIMAKLTIDNGTSYETAKSILNKKNESFKAKQAEVAAVREREAKEREERNRNQVAKEIDIIRTGKIGDIVIPVNRREDFINSYYGNANDPDHPGKSKVGIKMSQMSEVERIKMAYAIYCNWNLDDVVKATIKRQRAEDIRKGGSITSPKGNTEGKEDPNKTYTFEQPQVNL